MRRQIYFKHKLFIINMLVNFIKKGYWQRVGGLHKKIHNRLRNCLLFIGRSMYHTPLFCRARIMIYKLLHNSQQQLRLIFRMLDLGKEIMNVKKQGKIQTALLLIRATLWQNIIKLGKKKLEKEK